jgi:hypothetical protein
MLLHTVQFFVLVFVFLVFNSIWSEYCFQMIVDVTPEQIWILEYIFMWFYSLIFVACYYHKL